MQTVYFFFHALCLLLSEIFSANEADLYYELSKEELTESFGFGIETESLVGFDLES